MNNASRVSRDTGRLAIAAFLDYVGGPYQTEVRYALEYCAKERDADLVIFYGQRLNAPAAGERTHNQLYRLVGPERFDGLLVVSSVVANYCDDATLAEFFRSYGPVPTCSVGRTVPGVPSVVVDNLRGMHDVAAHLIDVHGRRRIAYVGGPMESAEAQEREVGFRAALADRGVTLDPALVLEGQFTQSSGEEAAQQLLASGAEFDALVAANDEMAFGALRVLEREGTGVPERVAVCGFDDVPQAAQNAPTLSTVRQPLRALASRGFEILLDRIAGRTTREMSGVPLEFVRRESCGCGQIDVDREASHADRDRLRSALARRVIVPNNELGDWPGRLLDVLDGPPVGRQDRFLRVLKDVIAAAIGVGVNVEEFQQAILVLRSHFAAKGKDAQAFEDLWHRSRTLVGAAALRVHGTLRVELERATQRLGWSGERITTSLSRPVLTTAIAEELPRIFGRDGAVSLYTGKRLERLEGLVALLGGKELADGMEDGESFPARRLAPDSFFSTAPQRTLIALPLRFELQPIGVLLLESGADTATYPYLATLIGAAVKASDLHRAVIEEMAVRKRLEQEQLVVQARLAAQIQTALAPKDVRIDGLEIEARMQAATEVGGDYYDLLTVPGGGWLAMGDVTGHGLAAGLMALMLQSQVATLVGTQPDALPSSVLNSMNPVLRNNIRDRLGRNDHASFVLLRYERSGRVFFAGAHDPLLVWRAATGRTECIETTGVWLGALQDISKVTRDSELTLHEGDVLVLHTDGITEARNAHHEQFGLDRLCSSIEARSGKSSAEIVDGVLQDVNAWTTSVDDDMSLVVARYRTPSEM